MDFFDNIQSLNEPKQAYVGDEAVLFIMNTMTGIAYRSWIANLYESIKNMIFSLYSDVPKDMFYMELVERFGNEFFIIVHFPSITMNSQGENVLTSTVCIFHRQTFQDCSDMDKNASIAPMGMLALVLNPVSKRIVDVVKIASQVII